MRNYKKVEEEYKILAERFETEFKKVDVSENFYNCLENTIFFSISVRGDLEKYVEFRNSYKLNVEDSFCSPANNFTQILGNYIRKTIKENELDKYLERHDVIIKDLQYYIEGSMNQISELSRKKIWVGYPKFLDETEYTIFEEESRLLIMPILIFNEQLDRIPLWDCYAEEWLEHWDDLTYDEIGRRAASETDLFLYNNISHIHIISSLEYEGATCKGFMIVRNTRRNNKNADIYLEECIALTQHKRIRKLLEISNENLVLLVDGDTSEAYGFQKIESMNSFYFSDSLIKFTGWFSWEYHFAAKEDQKKKLFYFEKLQYKFPNVIENEISTFKDELKNVFKLKNININLLTSIVNELKHQEKGTMLVILNPEYAMKESSRLRQSSTLIRSASISHNTILSLSRIDGALIFDTQGICHSFGVILDGAIEEGYPGDPSRGARYNSALRYIHAKEKEKIDCLIVVISEDGYMNVLPTRRKKEIKETKELNKQLNLL